MKRQNKRPKQIRRLLIVVAAVALIWWIFGSKQTATPQANDPNANSTGQSNTPSGQASTLRLIAMGDMLPHDTVNQAARTSSGYNYLPLFSQVAPYIKDSDMTFCNQESPSASQFSVRGYPTFNAPASFASDLNDLGCNIINLANNHANDRGQAGITATRQVWDNLSTLAVAGTGRNQGEHDRVVTFTKDGIKFAFLSYAQCSNSSLSTSYGLDLLSKSLVDKQVAEARADGAQMIIAATHWCRENISNQTAVQDTWGRYFASKGVDIVIGTGPHWLQPVKMLDKAGGGKTLVWFSLGNFLSSQLEVNGLIGGIAVMEIDVKTQTVSNVGFMPTYMHYEWTAAQAARQDLLARHNLKIYPLDQAASALARSQNHTSVEAQTQRVTKLLNMYTPVTMLTSKTYADFGR